MQLSIPFQKISLSLFLSLSSVFLHDVTEQRRTWSEGSQLQVRKRGLMRTQTRDILTLDFMLPEPWENKCLLSKHLVCGTLLQQPRKTKTHGFWGLSTEFLSALACSTQPNPVYSANALQRWFQTKQVLPWDEQVFSLLILTDPCFSTSSHKPKNVEDNTSQSLNAKLYPAS